MVEKNELPPDFFYYHCIDTVFSNVEIFGNNPNGFSDYYLMLRYRCGIKKNKELQGIKNFPNEAR